jgi:hypothetical protein
VLNDGRVVSVYRRTGPGLSFAPARHFAGDFVRALADLDADGDSEVLLGNGRHLESLAFDGASAGSVAQYGVGTPGLGGAIPVLGVLGPVRPGEIAELRLRRGLGGSVAIYGFGGLPGFFPNVPFPGVTLWFDALISIINFPLFGAPGSAGAGGFTLPINASAGFAGLTFFQQAFVIDLSVPVTVSTTQGLALTYGF